MNAQANYVGLSWKAGGRTRAGLDCVGLVWLWLLENGFLKCPAPASDPDAKVEQALGSVGLIQEAPESFPVGTVFFFRFRGKVSHVALHLGHGKILNILKGLDSRVENGFTLLRRLKLEPVAAIPPTDTERLCAALADPSLGGAAAPIIMLVIAMAFSVVSGFLLRPSLPAFKNVTGKYGSTNTGLVTAKNPEYPLPDLLGSVTTPDAYF